MRQAGPCGAGLFSWESIMGVFNFLKKLAAKGQTNRDGGGLSSDQLDDFLHFGEWLPVQSSNVAAAQYDGETEQMTVEFDDGSFYQYQQVSRQEARAFAQAGSKGIWVWDHLRIRGTRDGHKKPFVFLSGPSRARRGWMKTRQTRKRHGRL